MRSANQFLLTVVTGCAALVLAGCPQKTPVAPPPPAPVELPAGIDRLQFMPESTIEPYRLVHPTPVYPKLARIARIQGEVVLDATISKSGTMTNLKVVYSPDPILTKAAKDAIAKWTYRPFLFHGEPTEIDTQIKVNFITGKK